jgi:hypothetical protein
MTPLVEQQLERLRALPQCVNASARKLPSGAHLISVPDIKLPPGWKPEVVTAHFLTPPGYPAAQPDCFWLTPGPVRLTNGNLPQSSNDSNQMPEVGPMGTWFSWHLQTWNPNSDSLVTYFNVIMQRLRPAR